MLWRLTRCDIISPRSAGPILREPLWTEGQMRRLQGRGVSLLGPPQGDEGHCCKVPCLQGRLSLERLHYRGGGGWRLWPRCAAIMRKAEKLPTRSSLPGCMKSPRAQRPNLVCAPSSRTSASSATTPTANRSFPNRGMRVTCETFSPLSFQLITREGSIKNDLSTIYLWAIVLPYSISQYYARSCLEQKQENLRGPCWTPLCRSTPEVLGLWLDGDYSEWSTDKSRTTNQSNENTFVSLWMRSCTRTLLTEKLRIHQSCI